ncbi:EAL domain-containing protein [Aquabacterium fontiphilum]|uniref:putative bifunctional diguanylate cyclase/phosphodiesterase n=1 Tax=Aquabacterium fontiphilum TaxID=450365 RepID=UPI001377D790|nr:EAL domain-containing protein [Aquabacterium fontiphilum]
MSPIFVLYTLVTLSTGLALLLVWRHDRTQGFTALLGLSHLIFSFSPLAYFAMQRPEPLWHGLGVGALVLISSLYVTFLLTGFGQLSGRRVTWRQGALGLLALCVFHGVLLAGGRELAQGGFATLNTLAGLLVARWMVRLRPVDRFCAVVLVLCGLNQFTYAFLGDAGTQQQTVVATGLRLVLGLALLYGALTRSSREFRRMRDRFFELTDRSQQGVVVLCGSEAVYRNPAFQRIFGMDPARPAPPVFSAAWLDATTPPEVREAAHRRARDLVAGRVQDPEWEGPRISLDGRALYLRFRAWQVDWDNRPALQVVVSDETASHAAAQALWWQATHDELTGLPNRSALLRRLRELVDPARPHPFALILLDVDRFKSFNDAHGHEVGDAVLQALAQAILAQVGDQAELLRLGEDEFALLVCGEAPEARARTVTDAIRALVRDPLVLPDHRFYLDVSMGVACHAAGMAASPEQVLQAANAAMRLAKRLPGTSVQWAAEQIRQELAASFGAEQALRAGLRNEEFALVYQPKVRSSDRALIGFEALVRWDRPGHGRISPLDFIPAAERTGLIMQLGALILHRACAQLAAWRDAGLPVVPVAVNVSPLQLLDTGFPHTVIGALQTHKLPPAWLTLEITESAAVTHMDQAYEQIRLLREAGVEVALDDFGTGFSSLNMLRSLPLHTVKIDRSLISPMPEPDAVAVVTAICQLAAVLHLDVVAEGVETQQHAQAARQAGCQVLQGYLFAAPLGADQATDWLRAPPVAQLDALDVPA